MSSQASDAQTSEQEIKDRLEDGPLIRASVSSLLHQHSFRSSQLSKVGRSNAAHPANVAAISGNKSCAIRLAQVSPYQRRMDSQSQTPVAQFREPGQSTSKKYPVRSGKYRHRALLNSLLLLRPGTSTRSSPRNTGQGNNARHSLEQGQLVSFL